MPPLQRKSPAVWIINVDDAGTCDPPYVRVKPGDRILWKSVGAGHITVDFSAKGSDPFGGHPIHHINTAAGETARMTVDSSATPGCYMYMSSGPDGSVDPVVDIDP